MRFGIHGDKPGPIFEDALADPDSAAIPLAVSDVDISKLSIAGAGGDTNLSWTNALQEELVIREDSRSHAGACKALTSGSMLPCMDVRYQCAAACTN